MTSKSFTKNTTFLSVLITSSFILTFSGAPVAAAELINPTKNEELEGYVYDLKPANQILTVTTDNSTEMVRDTVTVIVDEEWVAEQTRLAEEQQKAAEAAVKAEQARVAPQPSNRVNNTPTPRTQPAPVVVAPPTPPSLPPMSTAPAGSVISEAQKWVGVVPYGSGNHPSTSFSCDGYVQYVYSQNGVSLPRTADAQARMGTVIPFGEGQAGDLVWWSGQHIAIYDGAGGYYHSPSWGRNVEHAPKILWGNPVLVRL